MLSNKKVVSFVYDGFEDLEFWYPILRLKEEGIDVVVAGVKNQQNYVGKYGVPAKSNCSFSDINPADYDGLLIPGGWAPDKLRRFPEVLKIVKEMNSQNKIIGQICHAGWVTISAKILKDKKVTSTPGIKDDMENAGGIWLDEPVVADGNLVSSRRPADLPIYMEKYIELLK